MVAGIVCPVDPDRAQASSPANSSRCSCTYRRGICDFRGCLTSCGDVVQKKCLSAAKIRTDFVPFAFLRRNLVKINRLGKNLCS